MCPLRIIENTKSGRETDVELGTSQIKTRDVGDTLYLGGAFPLISSYVYSRYTVYMYTCVTRVCPHTPAQAVSPKSKAAVFFSIR